MSEQQGGAVANERPDDRPPDHASDNGGDSATPDEFDSLVLDESFVRGGAYEPPARTRLAIARYGDEKTSGRHAGSADPRAGSAAESGANRAPRRGMGERSARLGGRPHRLAHGRRDRSSQAAGRARPGWALPPSVVSKLPVIVTIIVVAIAAFLAFR